MHFPQSRQTDTEQTRLESDVKVLMGFFSLKRLKTRQSRFRKQLVRLLEQADNSVIGHLVMNSDRNKTMFCIQMYRLTNNVYVTNLTHKYLLELVLGGPADTECWRSCCRSSFSSRNSRCSILYKQRWRNVLELNNVKTEE